MAGDGSLTRLLRSLRGLADLGIAVVVADRTGRAGKEVADAQSAAVVIGAPPRSPVGVLRRLALQSCDAAQVVVTEDHCVAMPHWPRALLDELDDPTVVAAAGPVHDVRRGGVWDRAAFLVDYAAFEQDAGPARDARALPGMNTAYRRAALTRLAESEPDRLDAPWEHAHGELAKHGRLRWVPSSPIGHDKGFSAAHALRQRFASGRSFAARRARGLPGVARAAWAGAAVVVPLLGASRLRESGVSPMVFATHGPAIGALLVAGGIGEAVGALLGPGRADEEIV